MKKKDLSKEAQQILKIWEAQIEADGASSLLAEGDITQELYKNGYVEKSPFGDTYSVITCEKCGKIESVHNMTGGDGEYMCKNCY